MAKPVGYWLGGQWVDSPKAKLLLPPSKSAPRGPQWALELAKEVERYPALVDPNLYAQAQSYAKVGRAYEFLGETPAEAAASVAREKKLAGWARRTVSSALYGEKPPVGPLPSVYEVQKGLVPGATFGGPEFVSRWNRAALIQKFVSSTMRGQEPLAQPRLAQRAGVLSEYMGRIEEQTARLTPLRAKEVATPAELNLLKRLEGVTEEVVGRARRVVPREAFGLRQIGRGLRKHKVGVGLALGIAGLWMIEPLSIVSGNDDDYNTIEGLQHRGEASKMRRALTEFGSGWRGLISMPKILQPLFKGAGATAKAAEMGQFMGQQITRAARPRWFHTAAKRSALETTKTKQLEALSGMMKEASAGPFEYSVFINPKGVEAARNIGYFHKRLSYGKALKGTIEHERLHQAVREMGLGIDDVNELVQGNIKGGLPDWFKSGFVKRYQKAGAETSIVGEEFLAHAIETARTGRDPRFIGTGAVEAAKSIKHAARPHMEMQIGLSRQRWYMKHQESMVRSSANAHKPGRRHIQQTGRIVR